MKNRFLSALICGGLMLMAMGCQKPQTPATTADANSHEHETLPSYSEAVAQLEQHLADIKAKFDAGTPGDADDAIHEAGHLLQHLDEIVEAEGGWVDEAKAEAKAAGKSLTAALAKVHDSFHADVEAVSYDEIAADVQAAIDSMKARLNTP